MFKIKVPLDLTLTPKGIFDASKHSLKISIHSKILKQLLQQQTSDPHYIKFQDFTLGLLKTTLRDFRIVNQNEEEECIPVYVRLNDNKQSPSSIQSNILTFKQCIILNPFRQQATINTIRQVFKFRVSIIKQIKMSHNDKLKQILEQQLTQLQYGLLTMDKKKRIIVSDIETSYPIVGMWVYGQSISLDSMYVYDLLEKFIKSSSDNKCNIVTSSNNSTLSIQQESDINFIFQIYRPNKTESYLLSVTDCQKQKFSQTISFKNTSIVQFGNSINDTNCMQFTLRDKTSINNTFDLYSPIKNLKDKESILQNSPEFTKIDEPSKIQNSYLNQCKMRGYETQIQFLKNKVEMYENIVKQLETKTPEKMRFLRSPGYSSKQKTIQSDKLKESDLKILTGSKQKSFNSQQSTSAKKSIQIQDFDKVRQFLFEDQRKNSQQKHSSRKYETDIWDNIEIIEQEIDK